MIRVLRARSYQCCTATSICQATGTLFGMLLRNLNLGSWALRVENLSSVQSQPTPRSHQATPLCPTSILPAPPEPTAVTVQPHAEPHGGKQQSRPLRRARQSHNTHVSTFVVTEQFLLMPLFWHAYFVCILLCNQWICRCGAGSELLTGREKRRSPHGHYGFLSAKRNDTLHINSHLAWAISTNNYCPSHDLAGDIHGHIFKIHVEFTCPARKGLRFTVRGDFCDCFGDWCEDASRNTYLSCGRFIGMNCCS